MEFLKDLISKLKRTSNREVITILPHHAKDYFFAFFLDLPPDNGYNKRHGRAIKSLVKQVSRNPGQRLEVVSGRDSYCDTCPRNPTSRYYDDKRFSRERCETNSGEADRKNALRLNLTEAVSKGPMTAQKFFGLMKASDFYKSYEKGIKKRK